MERKKAMYGIICLNVMIIMILWAVNINKDGLHLNGSRHTVVIWWRKCASGRSKGASSLLQWCLWTLLHNSTVINSITQSTLKYITQTIQRHMPATNEVWKHLFIWSLENYCNHSVCFAILNYPAIIKYVSVYSTVLFISQKL